MARLTDRQQLGRLLDFLVGLSHPEVRALLSERGFTDDDAEEGFRLLRAAAEAFYAESAPSQKQSHRRERSCWWLPGNAGALA